MPKNIQKLDLFFVALNQQKPLLNLPAVADTELLNVTWATSRAQQRKGRAALRRLMHGTRLNQFDASLNASFFMGLMACFLVPNAPKPVLFFSSH